MSILQYIFPSSIVLQNAKT